MSKTPSKDATLAEYQAFIKQVCIERGWDKRSALEKMLFMTEEVGEVAKEVRKQAGQYGYATPDSAEALGHELVDVFNYILDLANEFDIDMAEAFATKWAENHQRSWETPKAA